MQVIGIQETPLSMGASAALERFRFVDLTKSTFSVAYATYGSRPFGVSVSKGEADVCAVLPTSLGVNGSFYVELVGAVAAGGSVFPTADGKGVASSYNVLSRNLAAAPGSPTTGAYYLVPAAGWGSANANKLAVHDGSSWSYVDPVAGMVITLTGEKRSLQYNGSAWVDAYEAGIATQAVSSLGGVVACYVDGRNTRTNVNDSLTIDVAAETLTNYSTSAAIAVADVRVAAGDIPLVTLSAAANDVYLKKAVCASGTLTITLSGAPGATSTIHYIVKRKI